MGPFTRAPIVGKSPGTVPLDSTPSGVVPVLLDPFIFPPSGIRVVDVRGQVTVAPLATAKVLTYTVPANMQMRVKGVGFDANDPSAMPFATWSLKRGENPVEGYESLTTAIGTLRELGEVIVQMGGNVQLNLYVTNNYAGSSWTYFARIFGWVYALEGAA